MTDDDDLTDEELEEEEMAKTKSTNRSLSVCTELYDKVQRVRQEMEDAGPCKCCGHDPGKVPLKTAAEKIVQLGLEAWKKQHQEE